MPTVHILAQPAWHEPAFIVGTRKGLQAVRDAIDLALADGRSDVSVMANDGEAYTCTVIHRHDMADVPYGYTDEMARAGTPWPDWLR